MRNALIVGVAAFSGGAFAQTTPAPAGQESQELETIEVTGSRIPRLEIESSSPVTVIEREDIIATGITDVGDLLQRLPSMSGSPIGTTTNNGGNGSVAIDLRGMGVNRTLTLVNGKRIVDGGDYQTIPASMIERVEILKDGGSAIYGADAVAGVVNIITRQDFSGLSFDVQTNDWFDVDGGTQTSYNLVVGNNFEGGNFVFGAEYVDQSQAYQADTPWDFFQNTYYIYPEGCENQVTQPYPVGCYPIGSSRIPEGFFVFPTNGIQMNPDGTGLVPWDGRFYNFAPVNYIQTPYQRTNLFANGTFDLTKNVKFVTEFRGNFRQSAQELAPQPYNSPTDPGALVFFDTDGDGTVEQYSGIHEDNFYLVQYATAAGLAIEPVIDARRRILEIPRRFTQDITQYTVSAGFEGTLLDMNWDVSYAKGIRSRLDRDFGQWSGPRLEAALGPSADLDGDGTPECYRDVGDPNTLIPGCVPANLFVGPGLMPADQLAYLNVNLTDSFETTLDEFNANLNGLGMRLPAGPLGWAVGFQHLGQTFEYSPDSAKALDAVTGNTGAGTEGSLYSNALIGEIFVPVFDNGAQSMAVKAGMRFDDYNRFGSETTWQLGVEGRPMPELKLRATAGTVFRAPTIGELFAGLVDSFPTYTDPCATGGVGPLPPGCAQVAPAPLDTQVLARVGGNPGLKPESGDTFTAGIAWEPKFEIGQFTATLDYWNIQLDDGISSLGVQYILDDCAFNNNGQSCALVTRNANYTVGQVLDSSLNVASQDASGIDTEFRFGFSAPMGRITTSLLWTHLLDRTKVAFPGDAENDLSGRFTDPTAQDGGAYATDKINYSARWNLGGLPFGDLMVGYLGEYVSALDADTFCNCDSDGNPANNAADGSYIQNIDAVLYHDLVSEVTLPMGLKFMAGITNVTDEEPPFIEVGFNATTDPSTYRMFGRGYFVRASYEFR